MDHLDSEKQERRRAEYVKELMDLGYEEPDAQFAVALYFGEHQGDVKIDSPVTLEEFRAMGLDRESLFRPRPALTGSSGRS
jgi:hypothetical protein